MWSPSSKIADRSGGRWQAGSWAAADGAVSFKKMPDSIFRQWVILIPGRKKSEVQLRRGGWRGEWSHAGPTLGHIFSSGHLFAVCLMISVFLPIYRSLII